MSPSTKSKSSDSSGNPKADKAQAILAGAFEVFTTRGYAAASMDRIASAAGVSKPTLYGYFQDKQGLFIAVIEQLTRSKRQNILMLQSERDSQRSPEEVLRQIAIGVIKDFSQNQSLMTLMRLIIGESEQFPELAKTFVREITKPTLEQLSLYLASQSQLKLSDPEVAARIFAGSLVHYLIVENILHGSEILPMERDRLIDGLIEMLIAAPDSQ